jgi:hypothetical protein
VAPAPAASTTQAATAIAIPLPAFPGSGGTTSISPQTGQAKLSPIDTQISRRPLPSQQPRWFKQRPGVRMLLPQPVLGEPHFCNAGSALRHAFSVA